MNLPAPYSWLNDLGDAMPRTIEEALKLYDTKETVGTASNPVIMGWAEELGTQKIGYKYTGDDVPWCGLFAAIVVQRADKPVPFGPLRALNWKDFGVPTREAGLGDVLVFQRPGGGHVGFYVGEDDTSYCVLGGNQGDAVSFSWIAKDRCVAVRRPEYRQQPAAVQPYRLSRAGSPLSTNEA